MSCKDIWRAANKKCLTSYINLLLHLPTEFHSPAEGTVLSYLIELLLHLNHGSEVTSGELSAIIAAHFFSMKVCTCKGKHLHTADSTFSRTDQIAYVLAYSLIYHNNFLQCSNWG